MSSYAWFLLTLALALGGGRALGLLFDRLKLPPILGQILAGLLLGRLAAPISEVLHGEAFTAMSDLGLVLLLLVTGTEARLGDIRRAGLPSLLVALGGVLVPFGAGIAAARGLGFSTDQALATGALFTPTSIGITAVTLLEAHRLRTTVGATLVGAAIIDDVLALGLIAVVLGTGTPAAIALKASLFFLAAGLFGWHLMPRLYRFFRRVHMPETPLSFVLVVGFGLSALAEFAGLAAITGAFLAGLAVREKMGEERLLEKVHGLAEGLFQPLFFVHLGAILDLGALGHLSTYAPLLLVASFGGKFLGSAAGARIARIPWTRALQIGIGMLPRMEVSLVIVALAARQQIFTGDLADLMTGVALLNMALSLLLTPVLLNAAFRLDPQIERHHPESAPGLEDS